MKRWHLLLMLAVVAAAFVGYKGLGSKDFEQAIVNFEDLTPAQQERLLQMEQEALEAANAGQPLPPDFITEEMILEGRVIDGVLLPEAERLQN